MARHHRLPPLTHRSLTMSLSNQQRQANRRLGLILGTVAVAFFVGFMVKMIVLGR
jgi:hypothetical protein